MDISAEYRPVTVTVLRYGSNESRNGYGTEIIQAIESFNNLLIYINL